MRLHVFPLSPRAMKVVALKNYLGLACETCVLDYFREDQRRAAFAALNPNMRQPVLEDDGFVLWESNAILHHLASKRPDAGVWPSDARDRSDVLRWLFWEASHWDHACDMLITERVKKTALVTEDSGRRTRGRATTPGTADAARVAEAERYFHELAAILDGQLRGRAWLLGDRLTIADFALGAWIPASEPAGYDVRGYAEITRWYAGLESLPGWKAALPQLPG